jgi:hypothetical protein
MGIVSKFKCQFYSRNAITKEIITKFNNLKPNGFYLVEDKENIINNAEIWKYMYNF